MFTDTPRTARQPLAWAHEMRSLYRGETARLMGRRSFPWSTLSVFVTDRHAEATRHYLDRCFPHVARLMDAELWGCREMGAVTWRVTSERSLETVYEQRLTPLYTQAQVKRAQAAERAYELVIEADATYLESVAA